MSFLIDFILHIDAHLVTIVNTFGDWTYLILFLVIFIETGAVIMPFLPGDSLLFAASALAANPEYHLNIWLFAFLFWLAPLLGDSLNFFIGHKIGSTINDNSFLGRFIKKEDLEKTEKFFEKHGGLAISLARFMPIIRTMSPFVAGGSGIHYRKFIRYNFLGATAWMILCCSAGYYFGNFPVVKKHFSLIIIGIIVVSLIPAITAGLKKHFASKTR
ncbi:VTT domain-containing protein [Liquorilactobacillus capillatus]|uniref:DedA family membrane protein n=1 Tax=Liquorilactobacillus capillatus DSM 19910 TaxID=1423731 RepID=A0A0R1MCN1_9LACO|nr:VTT domain-containing protein [Liquorilactobacillus capillatus]KRL02730.1 DedA family membrane protein [Liquorilactobacillus capillatus DSM 19910]